MKQNLEKKDVYRRVREREKKNINDIEFQYINVRSMSHLIKGNVIKHQY